MPYVAVDDRRRSILDAAIQIIGELGLAAATTRSISERAGAPLSAIHYYFRTKDALVETVAAEALAQMDIVFVGVTTSEGLESTIEQIVVTWWREIVTSWPLEAALNELLNAAARKSDVLSDVYVDRAAEKIEAALESDGTSIALPARELAYFLVCAVDGAARQYVMSKDEELCGRLMELVIDATIALARNPTRRRPR